jgi:hypothetical protein
MAVKVKVKVANLKVVQRMVKSGKKLREVKQRVVQRLKKARE